jgi:NAD(P)-dependent dehydrogenase (short-subunit alcohol dehydrogenase family)
MTQPHDITTPATNTAGLSRRWMIGSAAVGAAAGVAAGFAGGVALASQAVPPAAPRRIGARRFEGKVVLVTGGTSGIGRAAVKAFADEGGRVGFCGRREELGMQVASEIKAAGGDAFYVRADVLQEDQVKAFVDSVVKRYGRLDVAFNNAGTTLEKPLHEFSSDEWDLVNHTNVRGVFLAMKYELPHLIAGGGGVVLVTSSIAALSSHAGRAAYSASKSALLGLVKGAALDYAGHNIRINALLPGTINTDFVRRLAGMMDIPDAAWAIGAKQWGKSNVPGLERMGTPDEVASFALALAGDEFPYMTGAQMVIDGGKTAQG